MVSVAYIQTLVSIRKDSTYRLPNMFKLCININSNKCICRGGLSDLGACFKMLLRVCLNRNPLKHSKVCPLCLCQQHLVYTEYTKQPQLVRAWILQGVESIPQGCWPMLTPMLPTVLSSWLDVRWVVDHSNQIKLYLSHAPNTTSVDFTM